MTGRHSLGELIIAWGPGANDRWVKVRAGTTHSFAGDFHADAVFDDPDPFASRWFGKVVEQLLAGHSTKVTDGTFADPARRRRVADAFRKVFPDLAVFEVQIVGKRVVAENPVLATAPALHEASPRGIVIDDDVYGEGTMSSNETIVVESDVPTEILVAALTAAADRMMRVGEDGNEYTDADAETVMANDIYTPNYVSDVTVDEDGRAELYLDCKGAIEPPMAERLRQVLREELPRHGVSSAHVRVPSE